MGNMKLGEDQIIDLVWVANRTGYTKAAISRAVGMNTPQTLSSMLKRKSIPKKWLGPLSEWLEENVLKKHELRVLETVEHYAGLELSESVLQVFVTKLRAVADCVACNDIDQEIRTKDFVRFVATSQEALRSAWKTQRQCKNDNE